MTAGPGLLGGKVGKRYRRGKWTRSVCPFCRDRLCHNCGAPIETNVDPLFPRWTSAKTCGPRCSYELHLYTANQNYHIRKLWRYQQLKPRVPARRR